MKLFNCFILVISVSLFACTKTDNSLQQESKPENTQQSTVGQNNNQTSFSPEESSGNIDSGTGNLSNDYECVITDNIVSNEKLKFSFKLPDAILYNEGNITVNNYYVKVLTISSVEFENEGDTIERIQEAIEKIISKPSIRNACKCN